MTNKPAVSKYVPAQVFKVEMGDPLADAKRNFFQNIMKFPEASSVDDGNWFTTAIGNDCFVDLRKQDLVPLMSLTKVDLG